jgi:hypothetical protein
VDRPLANGTIFDSPWFALEKPAFDRLAALSDTVLTGLLIIGAIGVIGLALYPKTPTLLKAVVLGWVVLP